MTPVRRAFFAVAAFSAIIGTAHAANPVMFRDADCGCCLKWLEQVKSSFGQKAVIVNSPDMAAVKHKQGVPPDRKQVGAGESVLVRVDIGGRRTSIKKSR